jgi:sorbitol/mannitol transport system permease protein
MSTVSGVSAARFKSSKRPNGPDQSGGTMATRQTQTLARLMMAPSVVLLFIWMIVPLAFTLWFSFQQYNPLNPIRDGFVGFANYALFYSNPAFLYSIINTLLIVGSVLLITVIGGILLALLLDQPIFGQGIVRILVISPFFVMPPVAALVWKNMIMHPSYGVFADISRFLGVQPVDWFAQYPLFSVIIIVAWQWLPFATLILLTALQSLDGEQVEAAEMDGAGFLARFWHLTLPHMARAITVVILIQTIFLLAVYAEILVTTNGGPGYASTNLPFLVYQKASLEFKIGQASAGGIIAVILANIVAFFAMRAVGKNLDR